MRDVLRSAVNDIQQRVQRDWDFIVESLGGAPEESPAVPAQEAQFVEVLPE
ncbi:hypothetical protein ACFL45_09495 [Candidatus Neomarinimicrobiota bacterium]